MNRLKRLQGRVKHSHRQGKHEEVSVVIARRKVLGPAADHTSQPRRFIVVMIRTREDCYAIYRRRREQGSGPSCDFEGNRGKKLAGQHAEYIYETTFATYLAQESRPMPD